MQSFHAADEHVYEFCRIYVIFPSMGHRWDLWRGGGVRLPGH